jgi:hypothetical protein
VSASSWQGYVTSNGYLRVSHAGGNNVQIPDFETYNGASNASGTQHTGWWRITGYGVKHGEITWHPAETIFRFRTSSGSNFDGWASVYALNFSSQSTADSKTDVQTLDVVAAPKTRGRAAAKRSLLDRARELRPVSYTSKGAEDVGVLHSFIAEEAAEVVPEITSFDGTGAPAGINLSALSTVTLALVQHLLDRVDALEAELKKRTP